LKVLIITYYWPPAGGSGVQRWLKFVKYLQDFGVEPVVYTVENPNYPILDASLLKDIPETITILKQPIREPNNVVSFFKKKKPNQSAGFLDPNPNFIGKMMQYIRANYFIPDARKYWIQPSVKYLRRYLLENSVDAIITSGPPHSLHLIGMQLKQGLDVKWISDFRDPWTEIDYFEQLPLTKKAREKHFQLEKEVLEKSDTVLVIGKTMKTKFDAFSKNVKVVTNGFDSDLNPEVEKLDVKFTITHIGLMNADRNPISFWKAISELSNESVEFAKDVRIKIVGKVAQEVKDSIQKYAINNVDFEGYLSHDEVRKFQQKSQVLLLAVNNVKSAKGIITGKIFEYLQAKRPILAIGPKDGDLAEIIHKTKSGEIVDFNQVSELKDKIWSFYQLFKEGRLESKSVDIEKYHRKELTNELVNIIKETIS
jgi:glycosyltransferase involved in cell wall biosynthesis